MKQIKTRPFGKKTSIIKRLAQAFQQPEHFATYTARQRLRWFNEKSKMVQNKSYVQLSHYINISDIAAHISGTFANSAARKVITHDFTPTYRPAPVQKMTFEMAPKLVPSYAK